MERWGEGQLNIRSGPSFVDHPIDPTPIEDVRCQVLSRHACTHVFPTHKLHVTFIELGKASSTAEMMRRLGYRGDEQEVREGYLWLFDKFGRLPEEKITVRAERLKPMHHNLTIGLAKEPAWMEMRMELVARVMEMLRRLGVADVEGFVGHDPLLYRLRKDKFDPHLSLGNGYRDRYRSIKDVRGLKITLQPPRLRICIEDVAKQPLALVS